MKGNYIYMNKKTLDRINLAYQGELGEEMQHNTQSRVSWMCNNARGKTVLDIGCSQGMVSLILGREGKSVTGIDIVPEQISYAQQELELEDTSVQKNIRFICADFLGFEFETETYDTVIMGEFLEHVFDPILYLKKATALLNENGKLIVTVPFGINPFPDHKRTYYFLELFQQIDGLIHVDSIRMFGRWIGFVADKSLKESKIEINAQLVALLENAFFALDESSNNKIKSLMASFKDYENKRNEMEAQLSQLSKQNEEKENRLNEDANQIKRLEEKTAALDNENREIQKRFEDMNSTAYSTKKDLDLLIQKHTETEQVLVEAQALGQAKEKAVEERNEIIKTMRAEIEQLERINQQGKKSIEELKEKNRIITEQLEALVQTKNKIESELTKLHELEQEKDKLLAEKKETMETLNSTISKLKADNLQLSKRFEDMNRVAYSGKKKIRFLQQENDSLRERYSLYKTSYKRLFNLRGIQIWMKGRKLVGKPYKIESDDGTFSVIPSDIGKESNEQVQQKQIITAAEKRKTYEEKSRNQEFYNNIEDLTKTIKDSNGSGYYKKAGINVGIITDDFMYNYYKDAVNLIYLSPDNYQDVIANHALDMVLFVSCWHGMFGREDYSGDAKRNKILEILDYAREKKIISVFQTIEDPTNYNTFIKIAKAADVIFTSDINMVEKYKKETGNDKVYVLGYGINPQFHNPIGSFKKRNSESVFFAGSWTV